MYILSSKGQPLRMGYCPQMDALDGLLTVRETLDIYARLRGISTSCLKEVIHKVQFIYRIGLTTN